MLAPRFQALTKYFASMMDDLHANAATSGCLGANFYQKEGQRTSGNEILAVWSFRSIEDLHKCTVSPLHREGWVTVSSTYTCQGCLRDHVDIDESIAQVNLYRFCHKKKRLFGNTTRDIRARTTDSATGLVEQSDEGIAASGYLP